MTDVPGASAQPSAADWGRFLLRNKVTIVVVTAACAISALAISYTMAPKFKADVKFMIAENSDSGAGQLAGGLGGLAALAGITIGAGGQNEESLEYLRSRVFTSGFITQHELMPVLFPSKWDFQAKNWKSRDSEKIPTIGAAVDKFSNQIRTISEDRRTGVVTLSITWTDRRLAAEWANVMVAEADRALREKRQAELSKTINYLTEEAAKTNEVGVRDTVYKVMETQLKNSMLARTRDEYAFRIVDPAVIPDATDKVSPRRGLMSLAGAFIGMFAGMLFAAYRRPAAHPR